MDLHEINIGAAERANNRDSVGKPTAVDHAKAVENAIDDPSGEKLQDQKSRRRWLPKRGLTVRPDARVDPRPYVHKYFFRRPRLQQYYQHGALIDARGHRKEPMLVEELVLSKSALADGEGGTLDRSDSQAQVPEQSAADTSKVQRGLMAFCFWEFLD
jgi:hypothetical protein